MFTSYLSELKPGTVQIYIRMEYLQWWGRRENRASAITENMVF